MTVPATNSRERRAGHVEVEPRTKLQRTRGAPSDYNLEMLAEAAELAEDGLTHVEIAERLGIDITTFYRWMRKHPDFCHVVKSAKAAPDERVKDSLFQQAIAGNTTAQIFWLKNRQPRDWRDRQEHELVVPVGDNLSEEDTDTRRLALAALALMREAGDAPTIEGNTNADDNMAGRDSRADARHHRQRASYDRQATLTGSRDAGARRREDMGDGGADGDEEEEEQDFDI